MTEFDHSEGSGNTTLLSKIPKNFLSWGILLAALVAILMSAPSTKQWNLTSISDDEILVYQGELVGLSRNLASAQNPIPLGEYKPGSVNSPVQFHVPSQHVGSDQFVLVAGLSDKMRLFYGGSLAGQSEENEFQGIGFPSQFLIGPNSEIRARPDSLRFDILSDVAQVEAWVDQVFIGDQNDRAIVSDAFIGWKNRMATFASLAGAVALLSGIAGLLYGRRRHIYAAGSIAGLAYFAIVSPAWSPFMPVFSDKMLSLGLLLPGAIVIWGTAASEKKQLDLFDAFCASLLILGGLAGLLLPVLERLGADFFTARHLINLSAIPLCLIALPRALASDLREMFDKLQQSRREVGLRDQIIEQQERKMQDQIRQQAILEERQRFVRDMHDGVGGNLLSLLMRVRTKRVDLDKVELELEDGLTDLRLVVDSMDQVGGSLVQALAMFKARSARQLEAADIAMDWIEEGDFSTAAFDSRAILNIYRILQEATTNAVRHANPKAIRFEMRSGENSAPTIMRICDDGDGFAEAEIEAGRGLANMRKRAEKLGGKLELVHSDSGKGTCVTLTLNAI